MLGSLASKHVGMNFLLRDYLQPYMALCHNFSDVTDMTSIDHSYNFSLSPGAFEMNTAVFCCDLRRSVPNLLSMRQVHWRHNYFEHRLSDSDTDRAGVWQRGAQGTSVLHHR